MIVASLLLVLLLGGCTHTYSQEKIGEEPENLDETTILGTWYFEGKETECMEFYDDGTYKTDHDGNAGSGSYSLSDDYKTIHIDDDETDIDEDVEVMYGKDVLYFRWKGGREQIFTRYLIEEDQ